MNELVKMALSGGIFTIALASFLGVPYHDAELIGLPAIVFFAIVLSIRTRGE